MLLQSILPKLLTNLIQPIPRTTLSLFSTSKPPTQYPTIDPTTLSAWHQWLHVNHNISNGIWLRLYKKSTKGQLLKYDDALDEALCYGWIDGQRRSLDAGSFLQKFTPRRQRSQWSERNKGIVERLEKEGRMTQAGRREVQRAMDDDRWNKSS